MSTCQNCGKHTEAFPFSAVTEQSLERWSTQNSIESIVHSNASLPVRCDDCSAAVAKNQVLTTCWMLLLIAIGLLYYFIKGPVGHY